VHRRAIVFALLGVTLVWAWLRVGVSLAAAASDGRAPMVADVLFTVVLYAPMLAVAIPLGMVAGTPLGRPNRRSAGAFGSGLVIGGAALALSIAYCAVAGTLVRGDNAGVAGALFIGTLVIALQVLAEEVVFRGTIQPLLVRGSNSALGILVTAIGFALLHGVAESVDPLTAINMLLGGVLFGALALRGGGIAAAFGAHLAWNMAEQLGVGLDPNPGMGSFGALLNLDLVGGVRWGGSETGLNASWAMSFALASTVIVVVGWPNRRVRPPSRPRPA
jgi:membrane protease YdiL (CAAX protease family)